MRATANLNSVSADTHLEVAVPLECASHVGPLRREVARMDSYEKDTSSRTEVPD